MAQESIPSQNPQPGETPGLLAHAEDVHGSMSLVVPDSRLNGYARAETAEITDFTLEDSDTALLNGQRLLSAVERQARERGIHWLIATSGPNGNETTTAFYDAVFGKSVGMADDYDGPNYGRQIWLRKIEPKKD